MSGVAPNAPFQWMKANDLPHGPDDASLHVDEQAGTITVEVFATDADSRTMLHAGRVMTTLATFPLKVPPPPGLIEAYQHTVARLRQERNAAEAIRRETAERIAAHIVAEANRTVRDAELAGNDGMKLFGHGVLSAGLYHVWDAMGWELPTGGRAHRD
jgi:hypothetical protein